MSHTDLWNYCTAAHCREFLLSLGLLDHTGWPPEKQLACLYAVSNRVEAHYHRRLLPKGDGTHRELLVPDPLLMGIQTRILRGILAPQTISPQATAYHRGADVLTNARAHTGRPLLLKMDIKAFFDSVTFSMVYARAFPAVLFPPPVRALLTSLCCHGDRLPQGAPTSAAISNLVLRPFDDHMAAWCGERGITYTRYSDDMAFSGDFDPQMVVSKVERFLEALGFRLNTGKTRLLRQHQRQLVTGVVVNQKPQSSRAYRRALRQEIHHCLRHGVASHLERTQREQEPARYLASLLGKINHVLHLNPRDAYFRQARDRIAALAESTAAS